MEGRLRMSKHRLRRRVGRVFLRFEGECGDEVGLRKQVRCLLDEVARVFVSLRYVKLGFQGNLDHSPHVGRDPKKRERDAPGQGFGGPSHAATLTQHCEIVRRPFPCAERLQEAPRQAPTWIASSFLGTPYSAPGKAAL